MAKPNNPMSDLYRKLATFGLPKNFVRSTLLPSWWDDEAGLTPGGFSEALLHVSRSAGLDLASLRDLSKPVQPVAVPVRFKHNKAASSADLGVARTLACQVARMAATAAPELKPYPATATEIRELLLEDRNWVDLEALVDFCWSVGIPVLHVTEFPPKTKRMQGLAVNVDGRPVIVCTNNKRAPAWLLFDVAHELGHGVLGHVQPGGALVDDLIDRESIDADEVAANRFALELLSGMPGMRTTATNWPKAAALAEEAMLLAVERQTDPGVIILNYAFSMGPDFFPVGNAALSHLTGQPDGPSLIRRKMADALDWAELPEDSSEFLSKMTAVPPSGVQAAV